ncbi:MAG: ftsI [Bacteroidetes bacterium]|nr:ftsI [Bacteroidota bacterium]
MIRIYIGFLFIVLLSVGILAKVAHTQIYDAHQLIAESDSLSIFTKTVLAERGNIYSQDGRLLATSLPIFDVHIDFEADGLTDEVFSNANVDSVCMLLAAKYHDRSKDDYKADFHKHHKKGDSYYLLKKEISLADLNEMKSWPWFRLSKNKSGLIIETKEMRDHPFGDIALRTLGIDENHDGAYSSGVELKYDKELTGEKLKKLYRKLSGGASKPLDTKEETANSGKDIYTTIDINMQDVAEDALRKALTKHDAEHGCVILMEVKTGKIKAIANLGRRDSANYRELYNYAVGEATEPGSVMKLATAASLMEDKLADNNTPIQCGNGVLVIHDLTIRDHEAPETPVLTLKRAIEVSSNVAMAQVAKDFYVAKPAQFYDHLKAFGFTEPVKIEVGGAAKPVLADPKKWSGVSAPYIAHGYEIQITPLHTLQFYNAIANGGVMVKPTLIEKVREYNQTIDSPGTTVLNAKLLSESTVKQLRDILEGVVENGTAKNLKTTYLKIAGKTGTAVISNHGYKINKKYQASFVGYFPADKPEYSMIIVVNSPSQGGYYGNVVAGDIFREVADKVYSLSLDMHPSVNSGAVAENNIPEIKNASRDDITRLLKMFDKDAPVGGDDWMMMADDNGYTANDIKVDMVPDVKGMGLKDALFLLESRGLQVEFKGRGNVKGQSIDAGTKISKGQKIVLQLS